MALETVTAIDGFRMVEFVAVNIRQTGATEYSVSKHPMLVQPSLVASIGPAVIPGELAGPGGQPIGKAATALLIGSSQVLVEGLPQEAEYRLATETHMIVKPASKEKESTIVS